MKSFENWLSDKKQLKIFLIASILIILLISYIALVIVPILKTANYTASRYVSKSIEQNVVCDFRIQRLNHDAKCYLSEPYNYSSFDNASLRQQTYITDDDFDTRLAIVLYLIIILTYAIILIPFPIVIKLLYKLGLR